ncbi:PilT domain-containing protein (fragment) [Agrobacterium sp. NCPPB 925]
MASSFVIGLRNIKPGRILSFDEKAALIWGELMAQGKASGRPRSALDTIVAAIAQSNGCIVVTDNERDFHGVEIINPLRQTAI